MIDQLRQRLQALQKAPGIEGRPGTLPFGIPAIDTMLGGGLARGALHEIAATGEAHLPAAAGFALAVAKRAAPSPRLFWISEDMALAESGVPHGAGLDAFGLAPEQLVMVSTTHRRDLLWAMEEALRCGATTAVIGEMRAGAIDGVAIRRLSLAAAESSTLALLLRTEPPGDRFDRSHALGRRCSTFDRSRHTARCRAACPQPPRPDRNVDSRME